MNNFLFNKSYYILHIALLLSSLSAMSQDDGLKRQDVLGHGFDVRYVDALDWGTSSKGKLLFKGGSSTSKISSSPAVSYHFVTTPYEYEKELLRTDSLDSPFQSINSHAYYEAFEADGSDKLLFVYTQKRKPIERKSLRTSSTKTLDSAMVADFSRLGRDITPEGFIHRYGTHYADQVVYGGIFLKRNLIKNTDYIYSPYEKDEFQQQVVKDIIATHTGASDPDLYINAGQSNTYTIGGTKDAQWFTDWEGNVSQNSKPIEVTLQTFSELFRTVSMPEVEDKAKKVRMLDSVIEVATAYAQKAVQRPVTSKYYKKYSLRFKQDLTKIIKKNMGGEDATSTDYTGDIFFGGFSKDDAILDIKPLIELGGLRLETLITDEEVFLDRNVIITIKAEDLKRGYLSVWDDAKKLVKGGGRTRLRVSGTEDAKTYYKDILKQKVEKTIELETIDKDIYDITYTAEIIKDEGLIENITTTYNYVLDTELVAAAATGNIPLLKDLFKKNGNVGANGLLQAIITNKQDNDVLNFVLDNGVIPNTEDLDVAFEPKNFEREKALILLERGAKPKNNMIYKAVAYKEADVIYALFREGAIPRNNDLAYALELYHYPTVKALMSEEFEEFVAGKNELLLAAENNDEDLAQKFVKLGSTADAYILDRATQHDNMALRNVIVPVTEASGETLEVVAKLNDTDLFNYFVKKEAKLDSNLAAEVAVDNSNTAILDMALKSGAQATEILTYAIEKDNKPAIEVSLKNKAVADEVFSYAAKSQDTQLFNDALNTYNGTPAVALEAAVQEDRVMLAQSVISTKSASIDATQTLDLAVSKENLEMVELLVQNDADPSQGIKTAVSRENESITAFLVTKGAATADPALLQEAVKKENLAISKILIEQGQANVSEAIVDATETGNKEITGYLLEKGAVTEEALNAAMETKDEDIILLILAKTEHIDPSFISTAARKGNLKVVQELIERGLSTSIALEDAMRYKQLDVAKLLIENGAKPTQYDLELSLKFNFIEGTKLVLEQGVTPTEAFENGYYPLHLVTETYETTDSDLIKLLISYGADVNAQNKRDETPLHLAASGNENALPTVTALLEADANALLTNKNNLTALDYTTNKALKNIIKKAQKEARKKS
ncbi:ankyrin repeat domain-containing protein [uncultured Dokdonia sp.]|uniref:ankyrin repeat domain-containing protein n=2 Tax=uncultured Dokdonia sp. TaxID=575653 RepID=UPI00262589FB|nr:ankyrin repeat domain-containing protein [uncultured Dokdonia sp.]